MWAVGASEVGSSLRLAVGTEALLDSLGGLLGSGGAGYSLLPISPLLGKVGQLRNLVRTDQARGGRGNARSVELCGRRWS